MSDKFYELCLKQYESEMQEADGIYQKSGVMLIVIPILGSIIYKLVNTEILKKPMTQCIATAVYYTTGVVAIISVIISIVYLFLSITPRKDYKKIDNMNKWQDRREKLLKNKNHNKTKTKASHKTEINDIIINDIIFKLNDAQSNNAEINEDRRYKFMLSVKWAFCALVAVGIQAISYIILNN